MSMKTLLREEFENELKVLSKTQMGTDEYKISVDGVTKLADRLIEIDKLDAEHAEQVETREVEQALKAQQLKDERIDKIVNNCLKGLSMAAGVGLAVWGTVVSMKFEKEDTFTSLLGRKWVDRTMSLINKR